MFKFVVLSAVLIAGGFGNPLSKNEFSYESKDTMYFPDSRGNLYLINLKGADDPSNRATEKPVIFNLFTRSNPDTAQVLVLGDKENLKNSNFNPAHPTRFTVHGWMSEQDNPFNSIIREAYLEQGEFNVIVVDWTASSNTINYISAVNAVTPTALKVAEMIDFLAENAGIKTNDVHMAGHSLGAHVVGVAGRNVKSGKIHTVVGLDPALPLFSISNPEKRIDTNSAEYVEIIHTNGGTLGFLEPLGHADFYPNGGKKQVGCENDFAAVRSNTLLKSLSSKAAFWSWNCLSYDELVDGTCHVINEMMPMGTLRGVETNHNKAKGIFLNKTNKELPFAKGQPIGDSSTIIV
ncbi:pancreatic lipase-related protein 2-like [Ctenocephalides felis]|uniref:pancreatic lipase-related protein 2-like n=1 Tax=Ctenocephalides felis TaxID=7515 RepID=UPI000E6E44A5|nr:pancreatic lipase-related protein 2-like [Ctenocephalides felis]